ncbi:hypothetical protein L209DRAFT_105940 [Thermothelomyces heterothallicus CBS 203.75]
MAKCRALVVSFLGSVPHKCGSSAQSLSVPGTKCEHFKVALARYTTSTQRFSVRIRRRPGTRPQVLASLTRHQPCLVIWCVKMPPFETRYDSIFTVFYGDWENSEPPPRQQFITVRQEFEACAQDSE